MQKIKQSKCSVNETSIHRKNKKNKELSAKDKELIEKAVKKVVEQYGETLRLLGKD
jgi:hypothetical protein